MEGHVQSHEEPAETDDSIRISVFILIHHSFGFPDMFQKEDPFDLPWIHPCNEISFSTTVHALKPVWVYSQFKTVTMKMK